VKATVRLVLGLALAATSAVAQELQVRATNQTTGAPLPGALISLRDTKDRIVLRVLADERGRATLKAPAPGTYRVRADAIGYAGKLAAPIQVSLSTPGAITIALEPAPLAINELVVTSSREVVCNLDQAEGTAVARIWDEARKALTATTLTRANRALQFAAVIYDRQLDLRGRLVTESTTSKQGPSERPFQAADPEHLHREGYVQRDESGGGQYFGPDADLLLSDRFLDDHCFALASPDKSNPGRVGLAFAPIQGRLVPDVRGTLWLDERSMELAHLEFGYTNVDFPEGTRDVGGRVGFEKLPNGGWIVSSWHIRMPIIAQVTGFATARTKLLGYREAAGEARLVGQPRPETGPTVITGSVYDSVGGGPLGGVVVSIQAGAYADTTDLSGRYRIVSPGVGQYRVTFDHPRFRIFGLDSVFASAQLARGKTDTVRAAIPGVAVIVAKLCPAEPPETGAIVGVVRDAATTTPIAATVTIRSNTISVRATQSGQRGAARASGRRVSVSEQGTTWEIDTDASGVFQVCGLPQADDLELVITVKNRRPLHRSVSTEGKRLLDVDIAVP